MTAQSQKRPPEKTLPQKTLHGRRRGKTLRAHHQRLVDELLPRLKVDVSKPIEPATLFPFTPEALWLEIGFGGGEHLAFRAEENPKTGFVGCEPFVNGVAKLLAEVDARGLENVRLHDDDARDVLDALPEASVERIYLLYPDPWPKKKHKKRRFVSDDNLARFARVLKDGGLFHFASDIPDYVRWTLAHTVRHAEFDWLAERPADWRQPFEGWPGTRYEEKALKAGRVPSYLTYRRRPR